MSLSEVDRSSHSLLALLGGFVFGALLYGFRVLFVGGFCVFFIGFISFFSAFAFFGGFISFFS